MSHEEDNSLSRTVSQPNSDDKTENQFIAYWLQQLVVFIAGLIIPSRPAIEAGTIYTRQQVQRNLHVSDATIGYWLDNKLPVFQIGTKAMYFLGDDLIDFLRNAQLNPKPKTNAEKRAARDGRVKKTKA